MSHLLQRVFILFRINYFICSKLNYRFLQDAGLKVKLGQTPDQISKAFYQWQKERNEALKKDNPTEQKLKIKEFLENRK